MRDPMHVTVAAVISDGDRFLVVEESIEGRTRFNQPAGHLEAGETLVQAVTREVAEETRYRFEPASLVGVYEWENAAGEHFVRFTFAGTAAGPEPDWQLDPDIRQVHWLTLDELQACRDQHRSPMVLRTVEDYLAGHRFSLEILNNIEP